jgi:hypothetical protein
MSDDVIDLPNKFDIEALMRQAAARAADGEAVAETAEPEHDDDADGLPPLDQLSPLPSPGDPYKAFSRPAGRAVPSLFLLKADGTTWGYPYACRVEGPHLVPAKDAAGNLVVVLRFSGLTGIEVTLTGRRLETMVNYLGHHRLTWIREQAKGKFEGHGSDPVVTGITIKELK